MIISASRRTDIPALYSDWFINRLNAGYLYVRNPMNPLQVTKLLLNHESIDCIVFWTKNPETFISKLSSIKEYPYYFHFTLNPYDSAIEKSLPSKEKLIQTFTQLSDIIGTDRIIWRYDPVFFTPECSLSYHIKSFEFLAKSLAGFTSRCMFSFLTPYKKCLNNMKSVNFSVPDEAESSILAKEFVSIASSHKISLQTCAMPQDYSSLGIKKGKCIDDELISKITGKKISSQKDTCQRTQCLCAPSIDIGTYNTCTNGCIYCYANYRQSDAIKNFSSHSPELEMMHGFLTGREKITTRGQTPVSDNSFPQLKLF